MRIIAFTPDDRAEMRKTALNFAIATGKPAHPMRPASTPFDITGTVRLDRAAAVHDAVATLLVRRFPADELHLPFLRRSFDDIEAAFGGNYPGYLRCDTPYHDLRHSLDTALLTARMMDGYQIVHDKQASRLNSTEAMLAIVLALFHDVGFLRRNDESHLQGAQLMLQHENRSVAFIRQYFAGTSLESYADSAELIHATNFAFATADVLHGHPIQQVAIAKMLGSADLISQLSDRYYLERCRDFLYQELRLAGADRLQEANGHETVIYRDGLELLVKTPAFYDQLVKKRLEQDYSGIAQMLEQHFAGVNPYQASMTANMDYLRQLIAKDQLNDGLRRRPQSSIST